MGIFDRINISKFWKSWGETREKTKEENIELQVEMQGFVNQLVFRLADFWGIPRNEFLNRMPKIIFSEKDIKKLKLDKNEFSIFPCYIKKYNIIYFPKEDVDFIPNFQKLKSQYGYTGWKSVLAEEVGHFIEDWVNKNRPIKDSEFFAGVSRLFFTEFVPGTFKAEYQKYLKESSKHPNPQALIDDIKYDLEKENEIEKNIKLIKESKELSQNLIKENLEILYKEKEDLAKKSNFLLQHQYQYASFSLYPYIKKLTPAERYSLLNLDHFELIRQVILKGAERLEEIGRKTAERAEIKEGLEKATKIYPSASFLQKTAQETGFEGYGGGEKKWSEAVAFKNKGKEFYKQGKLEQAKEQFTKALETLQETRRLYTLSKEMTPDIIYSLTDNRTEIESLLQKLGGELRAEKLRSQYTGEPYSTHYVIYHGTVPEKIADIAREGLKAFEEPGQLRPFIYGTTDPEVARQHIIESGPHDKIPELNKTFERKTVMLVIRMPKEWVKTNPEATPERITGFEGMLKHEFGSEHDKGGLFGIKLPVDKVPPEFLYILTENGNTIPIREFVNRESDKALKDYKQKENEKETTQKVSDIEQAAVGAGTIASAEAIEYKQEEKESEAEIETLVEGEKRIEEKERELKELEERERAFEETMSREKEFEEKYKRLSSHKESRLRSKSS